MPYPQYPSRVVLIIGNASYRVPLVRFRIKSRVGHVGVAGVGRLALARNSTVAHEVPNLGTLVLLLCGLAFAVAHKEEQSDGNARDGNNADHDSSCNASHVGARSLVGIGSRRRFGCLGLLLA